MQRNYVLRTRDGAIVPVTAEVYREYYRFRRKERYQKERDQKHGVSSLDAAGYAPAGIPNEQSTEEQYLRDCVDELCRKILYQELHALSEWDQHLIGLLYFRRKTLKEAAAVMGCSRGKVIAHRDKALKRMREGFRREGLLFADR